jgi:hypothetical protein
MQSCPRSLCRSVLVLGAALAIVFASGCSDVTHVSHHPPAQPELYFELEPNDFPETPDFVAVLDSRSFLVVQGSVEAVGFDIVDHIEFAASEPIEIEFYLDGLGPLADVDVTIYDPIANQILGVYASGGDESGTIVVHEAGRPFQFVIEAFGGPADWDLELVAYPHGCHCVQSLNGGQEGDGETSAPPVDEGASVPKEGAAPAWIEARPAS